MAELGDLLRMACEAGGVGVWEFDRESGRARWNETLRRLVGVDAAFPASLPTWLELVHPDDRDLAVATLAGDPTMADAAYRIRAGDGTWRKVLVRGRLVPDDPTRAVGTVIDVTAQQRASDDLVETLEAMTDAYYALDADWRFTYVNREAERILGAPRERLLGRQLWAEFPSDLDFEQVYRRVAERREPAVFESYYALLDLWSEIRAYPLPAGGIAVYFRDIGQRRRNDEERERLLQAERAAREQAQQAQRSLAHQATHDALTGLANRRQVAELLGAHDLEGAVLFLDIDRFKQINDSLGHAIGDALLIEAAERLRASVRPEDTVARMGGDEFVVLLPGADLPLAQTIADRILQRLRVPFEVVGHRLYTTVSIGIALMDATDAADEILRAADVALYRAKDAGRDCYARYDQRAHRQVVARLQLEGDLRQAVEREEFVLHHQPAFDLRTGEVQGVEALVRWRHPQRGLVAPGVFIGLAEDTGLIEPLGDWCLSSACRTVASWADAGLDWTGWVNVSLRQLARPGFARHVLDVLADSGLPASRLGLEMTESVLSDDTGQTVAELSELASAGIQLAIDDFGTGYSSLARIRRLPFDVLKVDRSFVADLHVPAGAATVAAIIDLAHALGTRVVAEGVESADQLAALRRMGCDAASGFLLAHPVPQEDLEGAVADAGRHLSG
ncbi:putative bifunctional diguanylate cyclase/phosphodiesterase [Egicoccus sp. AB-alg6-2]|uniref:putative bifunctional diguanylate cyclase/phosphodiesterase n=1 Tax=Egicoccus sp. AB-alg6-2 TaxID=3242692 RepID=UPI00359E1A5B